MTIKGRRYDKLEREIEEIEGVTEVLMDEDWHRPSGKAAYSPYDAVVRLTDIGGARWNQSDFEALLAEHSVEFDEIKSFESSDERTHKVFISLATAAEQGITGSKTA